MSLQTVKFYQTGTFTVGNRLLAPEERSVQANMQRTNSLNSGHRACQGCGEALGARYAIDAAMPRHVVETGQRTYCIVSKIARPLVTTPPGLLM